MIGFELVTPRNAKEERSFGYENHAKQSVSSMLASESRPHVNGKSSETHENDNKLSDQSELCSESTITSEVHSKSNGNLDVPNGIGDKAAPYLIVTLAIYVCSINAVQIRNLIFL